jgi:tRNA/rRNA methyltransferase
VLVQPSHPGNVGAAARAMKVMGFTDLVLVQPRFADVLSREEALAMASGATDILAGARSRAHAARGAAWRDLGLRHRDDTARFRPTHLATA